MENKKEIEDDRLINGYKNLLECNELEENFKIGNEFDKIVKNISSLLDKDFKNTYEIDHSKIKTKNFILTDNAIKKLKEIKYYISNNYPVLLEGPTGTAKTKSVEILCEEMGITLKRFNLSSETKTADLFGRYVGDANSFSGISFQEGVFIEAFKNGYTLLLDEINLASNQVLQSFEECLDSHKISCEIPGMPWKEIEMGKGFNLIATQNPNKGLFANKRQELTKKFLSRFHIINFDSFQKDELLQIAEGLGKNKKIKQNVLNDLVNFHDEWSNLEERKNDILCFTIREIEATINAIEKGKNIKDAILCIYGSRYKSKEYETLKSILKKYPNLNTSGENTKILFDNKYLYITQPLHKLLQAVELSFDNNRHVMIIGDEGTGKSQIAKYIAEYRDKFNNVEEDGIYYCECTEELKCSDLIGNQYPSINSSSNDYSQQLMKWEDGFLTLAIMKGKCCILDNIEEAPTTITERLNGLLDKKLDEKKELIFEIPECPEKKEIEINDKFRLLCICNYNSISKMSPAFLNRFDIITLEDQLYHLKNSGKEFLNLIDKLIEQHDFNYKLNINKNNEKNVKESKNDNDILDMDDDDDEDIQAQIPKDLNKLIYKKIISNHNENLSIYQLSLFCRAIYIFIQELDPKKELELEKLVDYAYQLTVSSIIQDDIKIEDFIYNKYLKCNLESSKDSKYFFKESTKLRSFMAKLLAFSMINLHICVIGKTGVGKTSCAREFSRIRQKSMNLSKDFYMHSFHSNTKPNHFYGNITMKKKEIEFINGSLLNAMEKGTTFIADEMNLSPDIVMKSLVPALDLNLNHKIFIPGIKKKIQINKNFFFIACQNDFTTTGRNSLPKLLAKKLKCIYYPEPPKEDIQKICSSINLELCQAFDEEKRKKLIKDGERIAKYMHELNQLKLSYIPCWSIRDITKVLKRVHFQSSNSEKYKNINLVDNIVFYTLSGIYKKDIKDPSIKDNLLKEILKILESIFELNIIEINEIKDIFNEEAKIEGKFLQKGKCGISLKYIQYFNKDSNPFRLPSLYNELFQILLAHDEEPILIIGESGYKTYLAQLILPEIKPIQLNSETSIGQLLGSTVFLSDSEVKIFYLQQIYNILDIPKNYNEIKMVKNWANYDKNNYQQIREEQENLLKKIEEQIFKKRETVQKFNKTLTILKNKLFNNFPGKKKILSNINLEFKPGLILNAILSGKSLILKYLSNLPTVVLERFNELFSGKHNLTLNEDIHDTFTKEGDKEISNLGESFRIFATCSLGEQNKLSEAVLSRFTVICSDKYKIEEQKDVLKSFLLDNKLDFNQDCINEIIQFSKNIKNNSLSRMINALLLSNQKEIFREEENASRLNILSFILYRINYGLSYKFKTNNNSQLYDVEEKLKLYLPKFNGRIISGENVNEEPFITRQINGNNYIESKYNKLKIECGFGENIKNENLDNLAFTKTFSEMVDYIHLGIATNTPVILEGGIGLGKQTAINYVAYKLNYKIINFIITQSTKIEDLLGKNQIIRKDPIRIEFCETKIYKILTGKEGENLGENIIIVFHNLNKASSALLESLCSIFDKKQKNILRPDGKSEIKSNVNLIGIINSQSNIAIKDKLPLSLINCVFYYILPKLYPKEIEEIIKKKFRDNDMIEEINDFVDCFNKSRDFSHAKGNISYFSLNDITKYILFRKYTKNKLDKSIILQIIFAYRFIQNDFIKEIMNDLGFLTMKINPIIKIKNNYLSINFKNSDKKNEIKLQFFDKLAINEIEISKKINTLNLKQKQCLLFLVLSVLCKRACIIQGDTSSGKTHLVRLFAEMLGQKLVVYQINKDTGLSIFTGQSTLLSDLEREEISMVVKYFEMLSGYIEFKNYLDENFSFQGYNQPIIKKKWSVKQFTNLIQKILEYLENNNMNMEKEEYDQIKKIANDLEDLIQPYKRFKKCKSMFIESLENGYWVLIDGIESANPVISDKLIRLCDENAELDLTETGENIIFSNNPLNNNKIHSNFHLFINYNPLNKSNINQLNEMLLNKCITFTLSPMDSDIESSAQIIYGFMKNSSKIKEILCQEISYKVSLIHQKINEKILENQDFFSGGVEFTGRIIKYISEELSKSQSEDDLCERLVNTFYINYLNSINNKNDNDNLVLIKNIIKNCFENLENTTSFETGEKDIYFKYSEIFRILRNIQKVSKKLIESYDFNFLYLLELLKKVEISDLNVIEYHIDETLNLLDLFVGNSIKSRFNYYQYYNLEIIKNLLKNIINYVKNDKKHYLMDFTLNDEKELINKSILNKEISKFKLVYRLETEVKKIKLTDIYIYIPDILLDFINSIEKLLKSNDIENLYENLNILKNSLNQEMNISSLFPFNQILLEKKENNKTKIRMFKIIFLIYKMIEKKINFEINFNSNPDKLVFDFKNDANTSFNNIYFILNLTKDFYFEGKRISIKKNPSEEGKYICGTSENYRERKDEEKEKIKDEENEKIKDEEKEKIKDEEKEKVKDEEKEKVKDEEKEKIKDEEKEKINLSNKFYIICSEIIDNKLQIIIDNKLQIKKKEIKARMSNISENIDEITTEFEEEIIGCNRTYSITKIISKQNKDLDIQEDNLIMKIWYLILFYSEDKIKKLISPYFCLPLEKKLLQDMMNIYNNINQISISKLISLTKNLLELKNEENLNFSYGSSKTFLYKIQAGFFSLLSIKNEDKKSYYNKIEIERKLYNKINSRFKDFWSCKESLFSFENEYLNLKKYIENIDQSEKYRSKLNELILDVNNYEFEGKGNIKEKLIKLLQSKLNNPTEEVYIRCKKNIDNYIQKLHNELSGNQILFPTIEKSINYEERDILIICLEILKSYSLQHKKLSNIFKKSKNILSDIFQLDKEIEIISEILGKYALENGELIQMYEQKVMGIIRALILYKIIKYSKEKDEIIEDYFAKFIKLADIINDQIGGKGKSDFNLNLFNWVAYTTRTTKTDLEDYLYIPKFEPKDFLYLFLIIYTEEKDNKINDITSQGFLFQNPKFESLKSYLYQCLKIYDLQELKSDEKSNFRIYIEKIAHSLLKSLLKEKKLDELSYPELREKLIEEKKNLEKIIYEKKGKFEPFESEEIKNEIIKKILNCFTLATTYEQNNFNIKLSYEDSDFFQNKNWSEELMSENPGMTYWLSKYFSSFYTELMTKKVQNDCFVKEDNKISFWYFQIRVLSNIKVFEYDCYKQKSIKIKGKNINVGKIFEDDEKYSDHKYNLENFIKDRIKNLTENNSPVNIKWINLVINEIPPEIKIKIYDKRLRYFYEFFAILFVDSTEFKKEEKNEIIFGYIKKVFDIIFKNQIEEFFKKNMNSLDDELIKFINHPHDEILGKIKEKAKRNLLESEIKKNVDNTFEIIRNIKNNVPEIIEEISSIVEKKTKEYHDVYVKEREKRLEKEKDNVENSLQKAYKDINNCLSFIKDEKLQNQKSLEEKIKEFDNLMNNQKSFFQFIKEKEVIYYKLNINIDLQTTKKLIIRIKNKKEIYEEIEFDNSYKNLYLQSSIFNYEDIQKFLIFYKGNEEKSPNIEKYIKIEPCEINKFDPNNIFNEEAKESVIQYKENLIKITEPKITFNGEIFTKEKLDNFINSVKKFDENLLKEINKYDDKLKNQISILMSDINEIKEYLLLDTTVSRENDIELEKNVKKLKNIIINFSEKLKLNLDDIIKIIYINKDVAEYKIFDIEHNQQILLFEEPKQIKPIFISNVSYLKYPMISDNGKKITFSSKSFNMFLGSYIPSTLSSPLIIKLLNIKENKIKGFVKESNKNIVTVDELDNENTLKIFINLKNLKSNKFSKEDIRFQIELTSENYESILIPFNLSLNIVPLSIIFSSLNHKLKYDSEKNIFNFNSDIVYANSTIYFCFKYLYSSKIKKQLNDNIVDFECSLESLKDNNSNKPDLRKEKNKLSLIIPDCKNVKNNMINFLLKVYFSSSFYMNIILNSKIYQFDFNLKWYSYDKKNFIDEKINIYIDEENIPYQYNLYLKAEKFCNNVQVEYQIFHSLPKEIDVKTNDLEKKNNRNETIFKVEFQIKNEPIIHGHYYYNHSICVEGNKVKKELNISFIFINKKTNLIKDLFDLPKYRYSKEKNDFIKENEIFKESIYITPFNYYIPFVNNLYGYSKPNFDPSYNLIVLCFNKRDKKLLKLKYDNYQKDSNNIGIIGFFNEDKWWYPIIKMENNIDYFYENFKYIDYENGNLENKIQEAKKMIYKIKEFGYYWSLPSIIVNFLCNKKKDFFLQLIGYLQTPFKDNFEKEKDILNDENSQDYYPIVANNLISILYKQFKNKYQEIKNNKNTLPLIDMAEPSNIINKIKEKQNQYFKIDDKIFSNLKDDSIMDEKIIDKKNDGYNIYILQENKSPEAVESQEQIILEEENIEMKETDEEKFDLSDISLIELKKPSSDSINDIVEYYNNCNKIVNMLYIYILSTSKSNNKKGQQKAGNYFQKLESMYSKLSERYNKKDYTFFSLDINRFLSGFKNLREKLNKIGYKFDQKNILTTNDEEENYIIFPNKKCINQIKDNWKTDGLQNNKFIQEEVQLGGRVGVNRFQNQEPLFDEDEDKSEKDQENINYNNEEDNIIKGKVDYENIKISDIDDIGYENIFVNNEEKDEKEDIKDEKESSLFGKKTGKKIKMDPIEINENDFNDEDGIKRALLALEEEKKKKESNIIQDFDLGNPNNYHKFKDTDIFNMDKIDKLNINQLYIKSSFLANKLFIKINGKGKVKYADTLVLLLVDPSVYISEQIKILNMFTICAMTNALNCLEIKYSIILMGDEEFRCVIKDYNEPHSIEALERVYECLMLKRFRTNIPGCLRYCLEEICNKSKFKYKSFFIFTDGLDRRFLCTQRNTWDTYIFNKSSNSFGFIFFLSSFLTEENKIFLINIWETFLNEIKDNSASKVFVKYFELKINDQFKEGIINIFSDNLERTKTEELTDELKYIPPIFKIKNEGTISEFLKNCNKVLEEDKSLFKLSGSFMKNDTISSYLNPNKEQPDLNIYKNNLHQIAKITNNNNIESSEIISFAHKFLSIRANLNRGILEEIFKPNKANLKVLSNTGTEIDIMALILYFLNPVPEPMIYLQDAIGNTKEYAITILIDTSYSVLNHINLNHSLNTIRVLLASLTIIDLPSFDLIVTGEEGPIIICSEYPSFAALNEKSKLWEALCLCLSNPIRNADLISSLQAAYDLKRLRANNFPSFLFVLTDGLFEEDKQNQLKEMIAKLVQTNIQVIGIGLGIYPFGITNLFGQAIYDINPNNLLYSILSILEGNKNDNNLMNCIQKEEESEKDILSIITKLIQNKKFFFTSLRKELKMSPLTINCYDMINEEKEAFEVKTKLPINPLGDKIGLLKENSLSGQQILIVMLWSKNLSKNEEELLVKENIVKTNESNSKCIKTTVDYLGVKLKIVENYVDAINEITKKDKNGKCNYYTVWVMCGSSIAILPDKSEYPGLVDQFIDCLLLYWKSGGAVVLFCENEPLYFQANIFLEKIRFKGEIKKTNLRIEGNDPGKENLKRFKSKGNLLKDCSYNNGIIKLPNGTERMPLGRNVPLIFEGETISHANSNNIEDIKPFIPFAKNSSGNICIMIYGTQGKEGDIIIDCGYTKLFKNMSEKEIGTWRYVQNITGFLARPEAHMIYDDGETAKNYRPKGINFNIDYSNMSNRFSYGFGKLDIVYMIDSTESMANWIEGVKAKCLDILNDLKKNTNLKDFDIQFGGVFYRDPVDSKEDKHEYQHLGDCESLKRKMETIKAKGGGDIPEDWVGAYKIATDNNKIKWREDSIKIIIQMADAGAHSLRFSYGDIRHNKKIYENGLINLIRTCASKRISIFGYQIEKHPSLSFSECKKIYDSVGMEDCSFDIYQFSHASMENISELLQKNIVNQISAFIAKNKK